MQQQSEVPQAAAAERYNVHDRGVAQYLVMCGHRAQCSTTDTGQPVFSFPDVADLHTDVDWYLGGGMCPAITFHAAGNVVRRMINAVRARSGGYASRPAPLDAQVAQVLDVVLRGLEQSAPAADAGGQP